MTHARIPDFSAQPSPHARISSLRVILRDPVLIAIESHAEAWATFWCVPAGRETEIAEDKMSAALEELLATPCTSNFGALAMVRHLRWLIERDAIQAETADLSGRFALAREADLSRFTGFDALPEEPQAVEPPEGLSPLAAATLPPALRTPMALPALRRVLSAAGFAGEALTALAIIAGGVFAYGFLPFA